ncbi:SIR2 family protein [Variovorax sp. LjRoot178]|uniref:SIR2 family protein n=1 Tax=Variovorax sp. LjRoot178 TaxID=3342277 RepID=UPI003ECDF9E9
MRTLNRQGALSLFVGAGISMGCGLPSWDELVRRVISEVWARDKAMAAELLRKPNGIASRYSKRQAGGGFNEIVKSCLYQDDLVLSPTIEAIAGSGIKNICTLNFDDLLEEAFQIAGIEADVATPNEPLSLNQHGTKIFHPHGMLSRFHTADEIRSASIVFSEDDYHTIYAEPYSWSNIAQITLLSAFSVLFVGLSMQDPNLRRLIDLTRSRGFKHQHFAIFRDPTTGASGPDLEMQQRVRGMVELDLKNLGVTPWFVDGHEKVANVLRSISVVDRKLRRPYRYSAAKLGFSRSIPAPLHLIQGPPGWSWPFQASSAWIASSTNS